MIGLGRFILGILVSLFRSKIRLEAENAVLRHQLIVLRRKLGGRVRLANNDRCFFIQLYRWFPAILQVLTIIRPETLLRWHRAGGLSPLLAVEVALVGRVASNRGKAADADPVDEHREPALGRSAHPWRTAQAGV